MINVINTPPSSDPNTQRYTFDSPSIAVSLPEHIFLYGFKGEENKRIYVKTERLHL